MRTGLAACILAALLFEATSIAQRSQPDFTGRWRLVEPAAAERAQDTLTVNAPDKLLITQTPLAIIIEHPAKPGSQPEAGVFKYGIGGTVGPSAPGRSPGVDSNGGSRTSEPIS